ncbi:hypothetical protein, partial [Photobacterium iliopiscarium]|uniref:hypothetical protein n=1 Tax=Photobacterium iliopiscarium TaxID=56192 RepID=UPI000D158BEA
MVDQVLKHKAKAIKGLSEETTEFITCLILHMLVPLLPLFIEALKMKGWPTEATLAITASMYSMAIGLSSRNKAIFSLCLFVGILFAMAFGLSIGSVTASDSDSLVRIGSAVTILFVFGIHSCERYNRHVV